MTVKGVDVASYQSTTFSTSGLGFVFVKATEGTSYVNPRMAAQAKHGRQAGLVVGFYHFVRPGSMKAQAAYFVEKAASVEGDPLFLDWEHPGVSSADKDAFLREVKKLRGSTHRVGLYCNQDYWLHRDTSSYAGDALWIADYVPSGRPRIKSPWLFHQYTDRPVDTNLGAFADASALRAWAAGSTSHGAKGADTSEQDGDEDVPIRSSLGKTKHQSLKWHDWTVINWDREYQDNEHVHADGNYPGYGAPASSWADFSGRLRVSGMEGRGTIQVRYSVHDWKNGKSSGAPWTELVLDLRATGGDDFVPLGSFSKGLKRGQHVYVEVLPIPADGQDKGKPPTVLSGRWTIRQDKA